MNNIKNICVICARAGSKRLKSKNFKKLFGKPLIYHTINQAIKSKIFDHIIFSTDSLILKKLAIKYGAESWFLRPKKLANDKAAKMPVIRHAVLEAEKKFQINFDYIFDLDVKAVTYNEMFVKSPDSKLNKKFKALKINSFSSHEKKKWICQVVVDV